MTRVSEVIASINRMRAYYGGDESLRIVGRLDAILGLLNDAGGLPMKDCAPVLFAGIPVVVRDDAPPDTVYVVDRRYCGAGLLP